MKKFLGIVFSILMVGCTNRIPSDVLSESKMEDVLVDYHMALALAEMKSGELQENRYVYTQAALKKHGITQEELDSSLLYWCSNSEKMVKVCERVTKRLSHMAESQGVERQEKNPYSYLTNEGDTANVWNLRKGTVLIPNVIDNVYSFSIEADSSYKAGDNFEWIFNTQFLSSDHGNEAFALLSIHLENDSIIGTSQRLSGNRVVKVRINCPTRFQNVRPRSVNGTVYLPLREKGFGILSINKFWLIRYHNLNKTSVKTSVPANTGKDPDVGSKESKNGMTMNSDTAKVRRSPSDIKRGQSGERTIEIVKNKPINMVKKMRR